jgi:hypothetical protein
METKNMKALLKLTEDINDVRKLLSVCHKRGLEIYHKKHEFELDHEVIAAGGLSINYGGYGSFARVGPGKTFSTRWEMLGFREDPPTHKPLQGVTVVFVGSNWERDLEEQKSLVGKRGGNVLDSITDVVDLVVLAMDAPDNIREAARSLDTTMVVSESVFQRALPTPKAATAKPRPKARRLGATSQKLWKLLSRRDVDYIDQALSLADAVGTVELYDDLLAEVNINAGRLDKGKRFEGTGPAQPYLDYGLLGLLSSAPGGSHGARVRSNIRALHLVDVKACPALRGFNALESLVITIAEGITIDDLKTFGALPNLQTLTIADKGGSWRRGAIVLLSIEGLVAPELRELNLSTSKITHVDSLVKSPKITSLKLGKSTLLENLDGLNGGANLVYVDLHGCASIRNINGIVGTTKLTFCNLTGCSKLADIEALAGNPYLAHVGLGSCSAVSSTLPLVDVQNFKGIIGTDDEFECDNTGITDLSGLANLDADIRSLSLPSTAISDLDTLPNLPQITHLNLSRCANLTSLSGLGNLPNLESIDATGAALIELDLPCLEHLKQIKLTDCKSLKSAADLGQLPALEELHLDGCEALETLPEKWAAKAQFISLAGCTSLKHLSGIETLSKLKFIRLSRCSSLTTLAGIMDFPKIQTVRASKDYVRVRSAGWGYVFTADASDTIRGSLFANQAFHPMLDLSGCQGLTNLKSLGDKLRAETKGLDLRDCVNLTSLDGADVFTRLSFLDLRGIEQAVDLRALSAINGLTVFLSTKGATLPTAIIQSLKVLPQLKLAIIATSELSSLKELSPLTNLTALEIVGSNKYGWLDNMERTQLTPESLLPLVDLPNLSSIRLPPDSLPPRSGAIAKGTNNVGSIHNFLDKLCQITGRKAPPAYVALNAQKPKIAKEILSLVRKVKPLLLRDFTHFTQGIELLVGAAIPEVWDLLTEGMDETALVSGEGKSALAGTGKIFRNERVSDALITRWRALFLLATAPVEATQACAIRAGITRIDIDGSEGSGYGSMGPGLPAPSSMAGFTALETCTIRATLTDNNLNWLKGVTSLRKLYLSNAEALTDLSGLSGIGSLRELHLNAPQITSLEGCELLSSLEVVAIKSAALLSINHLSSSKALKSLFLTGCTSLETLSGIEGAIALELFAVDGCDKLINLSALAQKPKINQSANDNIWCEFCTTSVYAGHLDLLGAGQIEDLAFLSEIMPVEAFSSLSIRVVGSANTRPIAGMTDLKSVKIFSNGTGSELMFPLGLETLTLNLAHRPKSLSKLPALKHLTLSGGIDRVEESWPELPSLTELIVDAPELRSLGGIKATKLSAVSLVNCKLDNLKGIGQSKSLNFPRRWNSQVFVVSFNGVEGNGYLTKLEIGDLLYSSDLSALAELPNLQALKGHYPRGYSSSKQRADDFLRLEKRLCLSSLVKLDKVVTLEANNYAGSLAFLGDWRSLEKLVMGDSGPLTDLEALTNLPALSCIKVRGCKTKRKMWPDQLQEALDFVSSTSW